MVPTKEVVEIVFCEDSAPKEEYDRDHRQHTHVTHDVFHGAFEAPQQNGEGTDANDIPLSAGNRLGRDHVDFGGRRRLAGRPMDDEEEQPNGYDGNDA